MQVPARPSRTDPATRTPGTRRPVTRQVLAAVLAALVLAAVGTLALLDRLLPPAMRSGVFEGGTAAAEVSRFEEWRGRDVGVVLSFAARQTWADLEVPEWWTSHWSQSQYADEVMLSVAMLPEEPATDLASGAAGRYDEHWVRTARNLVDAGLGDITVRVGHELNGSWYPWYAGEDPESYATYWRRIVTAMRSVPGQDFTFEWNVAVGPTQFDARRAYPGDEYVDYVGLDVYDMKYDDPEATPGERWTHLVAPDSGPHPQGLAFWAEFARQRGKPLAFSEWGVVDEDAPMALGGGGGDNPSFIERMYGWFEDHDVAYEVYFNEDAEDGDHALDNPRFARSAERYREQHAG